MAACLDPFALFMTILLNKMILLRKREREQAQDDFPQHAPEPDVPLPEIQDVTADTPFDTSHLPSVMAHALAPEQVQPAPTFDTSNLGELTAALHSGPVDMPEPEPVTLIPKPVEPTAPFEVSIRPQRAEVIEQTRTAN
jgi:hypothetical protein